MQAKQNPVTLEDMYTYSLVFMCCHEDPPLDRLAWDSILAPSSCGLTIGIA